MCCSNPHQDVPSTTVSASHVTQGIVEYESTIPQSLDEGLALWEAYNAWVDHISVCASQFFVVIRAQSICPRCTAANRLIVRPLSPPVILDVPTSAARPLHVHTTREILAVKGGTVGENVGR
jgi:hypothetical protein